jgi:hypothetical protein
MPSRFEPCGLTQMYSLRYGTVPVVRATGGLVDTVEPWDPASGEGTGFRFDTADGTGLMWALDRALAAYKDRAGWARLMRNGMSKDFSWTRSAEGYVRLYERAMGVDAPAAAFGQSISIVSRRTRCRCRLYGAHGDEPVRSRSGGQTWAAAASPEAEGTLPAHGDGPRSAPSTAVALARHATRRPDEPLR